MLEQDHPLFVKTQQQVDRRLHNPANTKGYIRYERDNYFKDTDLSNPWFITTLWEAQRLLRKDSVSEQDLKEVEKVFEWVLTNQYQSGVLAEQLNPYTAESRSATPLVWSHAVFIETVLYYVMKKREIMTPGDESTPVHEL